MAKIAQERVLKKVQKSYKAPKGGGQKKKL